MYPHDPRYKIPTLVDNYFTQVLKLGSQIPQLKQNIASVDFNLTQEMLERIQAIHQAISNPAP